MKKTLLLLTFLCSTFVFAQEKTEKHPQDIDKTKELKVNALTLIAGKWIDISYEYLIDNESSFGTAITINTDTSESDLNFSITPYYRRYFSEKYARGFFVEGFGMLFSARDNSLFTDNINFETGFGLGISVGGKFVSKKGFTTEILLGLGRNLIKSQHTDGIGRIGISLGYRF